MAKRKKAVVLIVEGATDQMIFELFINKMLISNELVAKIVGGDVFTEYLNSKKDPKLIVGDIVNEVRKQTKFRVSDIAFIGQIIDTDGIYISEEDFQVDPSITLADNKTYQYVLEEGKVRVTSTKNLSKLRQVWSGKKNKVDVLKTGFLYGKKIPYFMYYNSLNLEHVTNNELLAQEQKDEAALQFVLNLEEDVEKYLSFFENKDKTLSYPESWEVLQDGLWTQSKSNIKYLNNELKSLS